ncbi:MAG TPA: hypothetical protein VF731_07505 [Solirubrobacterales bacterium]
MRLLRIATATATIVASLVSAPLAAAEQVVPPGNSAATQYTETYPTAGGEAKQNGELNGGNQKPSQVLGQHTANALKSKGAEGEAVAELAAETAPVPVRTGSGEGTEGEGAHAGGGSHPHKGSSAGGGSGSGQGGGGGAGGASEAQPRPQSVSVPQPSGSSGLGEVLGQATGSSGGQLGAVLPLLLILTVAWSIAYVWRQRRQVG